MSPDSRPGRTGPVSLLSVDPGGETVQSLREALEGDGWVVHAASGVEEALDVVASERVDCVVGEYRLPDGDGVALAEAVRERRPGLPFVVFTDHGSYEAARAAVDAGVFAFVEKSEGVGRLRDRVEASLEAATGDRERAVERARLEAIASSPSTVVVSVTADGTIDYVSDAVQSVFGYEPGALVGEPLTVLMPERFRDDHEAGLAAFLETGERRLDWSWLELTGRRADGTEVPLGITFGASVVDGEYYFTGILRDIAERKRNEAERQANLAALRELNETSADPDSSLEEKCERVLELGCDRLDAPFGFLTRIDVEDETQRIVHSRADHPLLQRGESCPLSEAYCRKTLETDRLLAIQNAPEEGWDDDVAYERFELGCYVGAKLYVDGEVYGTLCFGGPEPRDRDFSEFERTIVELMAEWVSYELERDRREASLRRQNERLDEFVSIVSHDLRNPLSVVTGSLELAEETGDPVDLRRALDAAERMADLIDDLLALAREGEDLGALESVPLSAVVADAWSVVSTEAADIEVRTTATVRADRSRLQQALENLFRNSVEHGGADVSLTVGDLEDGFYVEDDGPGIPAEKRTRVFESGYSEGESGTGYGLSIVGRIAEAHDWDVTVAESDAGGARFEFTGVRSRD